MGITSTNKIKEDQEIRSLNFPKDRIPFYSGDTAANFDKDVFKQYERYGSSVLNWCCRQIEKNNYLEEFTVSKELFKKTAISLGYIPKDDD